MRKFPLILIILIVIISIFSTLTTLGQAEVNVESILYDIINSEPNYYYFNTPTNITYNGSSYAVVDGDNILVFTDIVSIIPFEETVKELLLIDKYLFVLTNIFTLYIYDITDNSLINDYDDLFQDNSSNIISITYNTETNILYVFCVASINSYHISLSDGLVITLIEMIINISSAPQIYTSNSIIYTSNQLLIYKIASKGYLYSLDLTTKHVTTIINNASPNVYYIQANNQYIFLIEETKVTRYNLNGVLIDDILTTGVATDSTVSDIGGVSVNGNTIYVSNPSYSAIKVFTITSTGIIYSNMYGSRGTGSKRLNTPNDLSFRSNTLYIADTMNDRVMTYQLDSTNVTSTPSSIGSSGTTDGNFIMPSDIAADYSSGLYIADSTGRLQYFLRDEFVTSYQFNKISALAVSGNDTIFVADYNDKKIYYKNKQDAEFLEFLELETTPLHLAISKSGNTIYIGDSEGIKAYSIKGVLLPYSIDYSDYSISVPNAISVDYSGNIYILEDNIDIKLHHFARNINNYTLDSTFILENDNQTLNNPQGMTLGDDGRIFLANTDYHTIAVIASNVSQVITENSSSYNHPGEIVNPTRIAYIKQPSTIYYSPNNYEDINSIDTAECVPVLAEITYNDIHYYYVEYENRKAYIKQTDTILMNSSKAPMDYARSLHPTMDIYLYPSTSSPKIFSSVNRDTLIEVISNVAERESVQMWNWYEVRHMNVNGYVLKTEVIPAEMPVVTPELFYAKIRSPQLGEKVNLYSLADSHSAILITISDGTKVELNVAIDNTSEFTLIKYGDLTGYVRTECLVDSGLTTGQILAIILAAVTFSATFAVLIISKIIRKETY